MSRLMLTTGHKARQAPGGKQVTWSVPESLEIEELLHDLEKTFPIRREQKIVRIRKWHDTDDWRLYRNDFLMVHEGRKWNLLQCDTGKVMATHAGKGASGSLYPGLLRYDERSRLLADARD